ncbi:ECU09_1255 [Encephalitozoon cuniculi GB-M1]|uniref:ECU09_1255 protein n=1 Tax=Encephalitozoon cuniculi (strain GB-M1) TaxID=284813 RepID=A0A1T5PD70_ENCCU|nr:ECU09_1255 [Encephalitozoon cuniculi GB-M1]
MHNSQKSLEEILDRYNEVLQVSASI